MTDELPAALRTVGATRSVFEREFERTQQDPFAGLGDPDEGGGVGGADAPGQRRGHPRW